VAAHGQQTGIHVALVRRPWSLPTSTALCAFVGRLFPSKYDAGLYRMTTKQSKQVWLPSWDENTRLNKLAAQDPTRTHLRLGEKRLIPPYRCRKTGESVGRRNRGRRISTGAVGSKLKGALAEFSHRLRALVRKASYKSCKRLSGVDCNSSKQKTCCTDTI